jgi:DDE superfamily endonuclease
VETIAREKALDCQTIEIWFADEARVGQKNKITRRWAKRGTRPIAPRDQRTASTYIFGAVCPHEGKGAALILPACNTEAMNLHLVEIAKAVAPKAHAVILVDQADWHLSTRLVVPATSPCRRNAPSSTRSKTSGSSCATIGSPIASSNPTTISSTIAVRPGTSSSISPGESCPSDCANGRTGSDQWDSVLGQVRALLEMTLIIQ